MKLSIYLKKRGPGAAAELARRLGVSRVSISQWAGGVRPIPAYQCVAIEAATAGDVTRKDMRKDWRALWPEIA